MTLRTSRISNRHLSIYPTIFGGNEISLKDVDAVARFKTQLELKKNKLCSVKYLFVFFEQQQQQQQLLSFARVCVCIYRERERESSD